MKRTKMNKETLRMQMLAGIITESQYKTRLNENNNPSRMIELIKMYVDNYYDGGYDSAEIALDKLNDILNGNLDGYDKAFMAGEEDLYETQLNEMGKDVKSIIRKMLPNLKKEGYMEGDTFRIDFDIIGDFWGNVFKEAYGHEYDDLNNDDNDKFDEIQSLTTDLLSQDGLDDVEYDR